MLLLVEVNDGEKTMEKHVFQVFVSRDGVFLGTEMLAETQVRLGRDVPDGLRMDGEGWAPLPARRPHHAACLRPCPACR